MFFTETVGFFVLPVTSINNYPTGNNNDYIMRYTWWYKYFGHRQFLRLLNYHPKTLKVYITL